MALFFINVGKFFSGEFGHSERARFVAFLEIGYLTNKLKNKTIKSLYLEGCPNG